MAKISDGVLRDFKDGDKMTSDAYEQDREIIRVAINDNDTRVKNLEKATDSSSTGLAGRMTQAEADIDNLEDTADTHNSRIMSLEDKEPVQDQRLDDLETTKDNHESRVSSLEGNDSSQDGKIGDLETSVYGSLAPSTFNGLSQMDMTFDQMRIGYVDSRVNPLESQLADMTTKGFLAESYKIQVPEVDDTARLNRAIADALSKNASLILGNKTYQISTGLTINGSLSIFGQGELSAIQSSDTTKSILSISNANGIILYGFKLIGTASSRNGVQYGLSISGTRITVHSLSFQGTAAAGIYATNLVDSKIIACDVRNNLADGIHITYKSKNVVVIGNTLNNTGDDGIAVVSYQSDGDLCSQIVISNNTINLSKARGISHVGGKNITISNNIINGTASSGILVVQDVTYSSYVPTDTMIVSNQVLNAGTVTPTKGNLFGIEVAGGVGTIVENNIVKNSATRGLNIGGSKNIIRGNKCSGNSSNQIENQSGAIIEGNRFEENGTYGLYLTNLTDSSITNNVFYNNSSNGVGASSNATLNACQRCTFVNNDIIDDRGTVQISNTFTLNGCSNITVGSNKENAGGKTWNAPSTTGVTTLDPLSGNYTPNGSNIYVIGTMFTRTDTNQILAHVGSGVWKAVTIA